MNNSMRPIVKLFLGMGLAVALLAQAPPPFSIRAQQGANILALSDGGTLTFTSEGIGQPQTGSVTLTYTGTTTDRKSTRLNSSHIQKSRMPSSA